MRQLPQFYIFWRMLFKINAVYLGMKQKFLYTPSEIISRNPRLAKVWNVRDIGYLYMLKLVAGRKTKHNTMLDEEDVLRIFYFRFPPLAR